MSGKLANNYNVIDLFAGVGGISQGMIKAGFKIISANEHDDEIACTYIKNHPKTKMFVKDIKDINPEELLVGEKEVDVIVGGPPCQGFSMAGKRIRQNGEFLNDPRNYLFNNFFKIVKKLKPKIFMMENVAAILSMHNGEVKNKIFRIFTEIGYKTDVHVMFAADYGVPQMRRRAVFIGNSMGLEPKVLFPDKTHGNQTGLGYITVGESILDLPRIKSGEGVFESDYDKQPLSKYQKQRRKNAKRLFNHIAGHHDDEIIKKMKIIKEGSRQADLPKAMQTNSMHSGAYGRMDRNRPAYTITTRFDTPSVGKVTHPFLHRTLTPREAARIQSFDDSFVFYGSKSSIGKQIGNAVPPLLAKAIGVKILNILKQYDK